MSQKISVDGLLEEQETLLLPLWARAMESHREPPIVLDEYAADIVASMDYDFSKFEGQAARFAGFCIRSAVFDRLVSESLSRSGASLLVELGAGLDTRFQRVARNGEFPELRYVACDFPNVLALRDEFFDRDDRCTSVAGSIAEASTIEQFPATTDEVVVVAEGVLYFLTHEQVLKLLKRLSNKFPNGSIIFDVQSPFYLWLSNLLHPLKDSKLTWSLGDLNALVRNRGGKIHRVVQFGDAPYYSKSSIARLPLHERLAPRILPFTRRFFRVCEIVFSEGANTRDTR